MPRLFSLVSSRYSQVRRLGLGGGGNETQAGHLRVKWPVGGGEDGDQVGPGLEKLAVNGCDGGDDVIATSGGAAASLHGEDVGKEVGVECLGDFVSTQYPAACLPMRSRWSY